MITGFLEDIKNGIQQKLTGWKVVIDALGQVESKTVEIMLLDFQSEYMQLDKPSYTGRVAVVLYLNVNQGVKANSPSQSTYLEHITASIKVAEYFNEADIEGTIFGDDSAKAAAISGPQLVSGINNTIIRVIMIGIPFEYQENT